MFQVIASYSQRYDIFFFYCKSESYPKMLPEPQDKDIYDTT